MKKIREIYQWAKDETGSTGNALLKIRSLEMKLGSPHLGESRFGKLWNWIALDLHIKEMEKQKEAYVREVTNGQQGVF
jgi:hypothetical protein